MTPDEIIALAKRVGFPIHRPEWRKAVEEFAALVEKQATALEREACANICETLELPEWPDKVRQPLAQAIRTRGQA